MQTTGGTSPHGDRSRSNRIPRGRGPALRRALLLAVTIVVGACSETTSPGGQIFFDCDEGMDVAPAEAETQVGGTAQFSAHCGPDLENDVTQEASWTTSDPGVATVDDAGLATAVAEGEVTISAVEENQEASATLRVTVPPDGGGDVQRKVGLIRDDGGTASLEVYDVGPDGTLAFLAGRDISGDGEGPTEFLAGVPGKGFVTPFSGSSELACYGLEPGDAVTHLGSVGVGTMPRWPAAFEDFIVQSGGPPKAFRVSPDDQLSEVAVPGGQDFFSDVAAYERMDGARYVLGLTPGGDIFTNTLVAGALEQVGQPLDAGSSGGHVAASPAGRFVSVADPAGQALHLLATDQEGVPEEVIETLQGVAAWNAGFGGDPAWENVCLAVADRTREEIRFFAVDRQSGALEEAPGSPVPVAVLGNLDVDGSFVAAIGEASLQLREFTGSDCATAMRDEIDTGGFNLVVSFGTGF